MLIFIFFFKVIKSLFSAWGNKQLSFWCTGIFHGILVSFSLHILLINTINHMISLLTYFLIKPKFMISGCTRLLSLRLLFQHPLDLILSWWLSSKESTCNAGDAGDQSSIPGSGRSLRGGNGNPLQYSCLKNPMNRGSLAGYSPVDCKELDMTKQLSTAAHKS